MKAVLGFYKTHPEAYVPKFETEQAACFDFKASLVDRETIVSYGWNNVLSNVDIIEDRTLVLEPAHRYLVPTNLIMDIPNKHSVRIHPRSGLSLKQGVTLFNCEGVIDSDYVNPVFIMLCNFTESEVTIKDGDRIAQGELVKLRSTKIHEITSPPNHKTSRRGGFGSTGV
jgi:dUTP pyrophosphatase